MSEMPQVYSCDTPKARKRHWCIECRGVIEPGERYYRHHGIWDGCAATYKVCGDCESLREEVDKGRRNEDLLAFGDLLDEAAENRQVLPRFLDIVDRRGGDVPPWLRELRTTHENELR